MRKIDSLYIRDYRGEKRLLLLFTPSARGPAFESQMRFFQGDDEEFERRNVVLGTIFVEGTSRIGDRCLDRAEVVGLREDFGVNPEESLLILVDRDGTELMRDNGVVQPERIYGYVDQPSSEPVGAREREAVRSR
jgi:hypothetical protein